LKKMVSLLISLCLCLSLALPALGEGENPLDEGIRASFKRMKTSGGMVVAAKDGEIVYSYCYGFSDKFSKDMVTPDTYFRIASVSKLVSAVTIMRMVDAGLLDLDENLGTYLGDPAYVAANPYFPKIPLTTRHLMTHTSSLSSKGGFTKHRALSLMLDVSNKRKSDFHNEEPGSVYRYSNYGAGILGCLMEAIVGKRINEVAKEMTFDPLGIDAAYHPTLVQHPEKIATTYETDGSIAITRSLRLKEEYPEKIDVDHDYNETYGSVWMKGEDLCRIGIMLCEGGKLDGQQFLKPETVAEMIASQQGRGYVTVDSPYGLNVERVSNLVQGRMFYGHQGLSEAILCNLYFDPESHFVFALVTNGCKSAKNDRIGVLTRSLFEQLWAAYGQ